jgi:hypothetical protein
MAITHRSTLLKAFLCGMIKLGTPKPIMDTLEYKLSLTLNIQYSPSYWNRTPSSYSISPMLLFAIRHQNILGWDAFLKGFMLRYWHLSYLEAHKQNPPHQQSNWDEKLISLLHDHL